VKRLSASNTNPTTWVKERSIKITFHSKWFQSAIAGVVLAPAYDIGERVALRVIKTAI
jgi:hypothetical protein